MARHYCTGSRGLGRANEQTDENMMIHYHLNPRILTKHFISNRLFTSEVCFSLPCVSCICGVTFDLNNALVTAGAPVSEPLARAGSLYTKVAVIWPIIFNWIITWLSLFYNAHKQNTFNIALSRDKKCGLFCPVD